MITLKLLGSIKKYCGKDNIIINEEETTISNLFFILRENIKDFKHIDKDDLLILINGTDLSISGNEQKIKSGDVVTIANLMHGG